MALNYESFKNDVYSIIERNLDFSPSNTTIEDILRNWSINKESFFNRFGGLIVSSDLLELNLCDTDIEDFYDTFLSNVQKYFSIQDYRYFKYFVGEAVRTEGFKTNKVLTDWTFDPNQEHNSYYWVPSFGAIEIKKGMKFTKAMKFFFKNKKSISEIQNYYSIFSQKMHSKKRGRVHISIHPLDFLSVSDNDRDWNSCHSMYDGDYRIGNLNYMSDKVTFVAYYTTEDDNFNRYNDAFGSGLAWNSKCWRMLVHLREEEGKCAVVYNKHYPYTSMQFLEEVDKLILKAYQDINFSTLKSYGEMNTYVCYQKDYTCHYNDINRTDSNIKIRCCPETENYESFIGIGEPILCLSCGSHFATETRDGYCDYCTGNEETCCECCGDYCDDDDLIYIESEDKYVCPWCAEHEYFYCDSCDVYYRRDTMEVVDGKRYCPQCLEALEKREE